MKRKIVENLELILRVNNLTYREVAQQIDMPHSTFATLMSRNIHPRENNLKKLTDYIDAHLETSRRKEKYLPFAIVMMLRDLTANDAAEQIGIDADSLVRIIDGDIDPTKQMLREIEDWMGFTISEVNELKAECKLMEELEAKMVE